MAGAAFDPLGDGDEHSDIVPLALDRDPSTAWSSEDYRALNKAGVGFVVDAKRPVSPTRLTLKIPTPGFALRRTRRGRRPLPPPPPLGHLPPAGRRPREGRRGAAGGLRRETNAHAAVARRVDQAGREGWREAQHELRV